MAIEVDGCGHSPGMGKAPSKALTTAEYFSSFHNRLMTFVAGLSSSGIVLNDETNPKMLDMILTWMLQALAISRNIEVS